MGGVDLMDQQLDSLLVIRKMYKWYKKLLFRQCLLSSHKLYGMGGGNHDFLKFVHDVVRQLLTQSPGTTRQMLPWTALRASSAAISSRPRGRMKDREAVEPPRRRFVVFATHAAYWSTGNHLGV